MATHTVLAAIRVASPKPLLTNGRSRIAASQGSSQRTQRSHYNHIHANVLPPSLGSLNGGLTGQNSRFFISRKIASASLSSGGSSGRVTSSVASYVFFFSFFSRFADLAAFFFASASSFLLSI